MFNKATTALISALSLSAGAMAQGSAIPLPDISNGDQNCGGCYVVADVAGIAFGTETIPATLVNSVVSGGPNGTTYTTTSLMFGAGQFTIASGSLVEATAAPAATPAGASTPLVTGASTLMINGATLTSPTAYNVFTAYSTTRYVYTNGNCVLDRGTAVPVSPAYSVTIPSSVTDDAGFSSFQAEAESSFIAHMGIPNCQAGGENYQPTTAIPVNVTTAITTTVPAMTRTPAAVSVAATTTGATSSFVAFTPFPNATASTYVPSGTGAITLGGPSFTIAEAGAGRLSNVGSLFAGLAALVMGFVA